MESFIHSHFRKHKYVQKDDREEDIDVAAERRRVLRGSGKKDLLRLENLTKVRCRPLYNTPFYKTDFDITLSHVVTLIFEP